MVADKTLSERIERRRADVAVDDTKCRDRERDNRAVGELEAVRRDRRRFRQHDPTAGDTPELMFGPLQVPQSRPRSGARLSHRFTVICCAAATPWFDESGDPPKRALSRMSLRKPAGWPIVHNA
jgi:hypothetical protein